VSLLRDDQYKILSIFADKKEHEKWEVVGMGVYLTKIPQKKFWKKYIKRMLEYNWIKIIKRSEDQNDVHDTFILTDKGDKLLREQAISQGGDERFYKKFDRTIKPVKKGNRNNVEF